MGITLLWIYIALLIAGGLTGYIKAKSKASLIASVAFAIPLLLTATNILPPIVATICLVVLLVFFGKKYAVGRKFMPAGLMTIATVVLLILRFIL